VVWLAREDPRGKPKGQCQVLSDQCFALGF